MAARRRCGASGGTASRRMARLCSGSQEDVDESGLERTRESSVWSRLCFSLSISKTAHRHDGRNECIGSRPATKLHEDLCVSPVVSSEWALSNKTKNRLAHAYYGNTTPKDKGCNMGIEDFKDAPLQGSYLDADAKCRVCGFYAGQHEPRQQASSPGQSSQAVISELDLQTSSSPRRACVSGRHVTVSWAGVRACGRTSFRVRMCLVSPGCMRHRSARASPGNVIGKQVEGWMVELSNNRYEIISESEVRNVGDLVFLFSLEQKKAYAALSGSTECIEISPTISKSCASTSTQERWNRLLAQGRSEQKRHIYIGSSPNNVLRRVTGKPVSSTPQTPAPTTPRTRTLAEIQEGVRDTADHVRGSTAFQRWVVRVLRNLLTCRTGPSSEGAVLRPSGVFHRLYR
mmetsp:Transcript_1481/g.3077  ORF Transcript_1481/g.3077 Transcript_1481/m.3077 type:complete len:402 (+) Transcript_1481:167-1372(+)